MANLRLKEPVSRPEFCGNKDTKVFTKKKAGRAILDGPPRMGLYQLFSAVI